MTPLQRANRDAKIRRFAKQGFSYQDVGKRFGLTGARVSQIVNGRSGNETKRPVAIYAEPEETIPPKQLVINTVRAEIERLQRVLADLESLSFVA